MKKLFFLAGCLLALSSVPALAQTTEPDVIVVRTYEAHAGSSRVVISRGKQKSSIIDIDSGVTDKKLTSAAETYQEFITNLYKEGYVLQGTLNTAEMINTLIFVRAPKP